MDEPGCPRRRTARALEAGVRVPRESGSRSWCHDFRARRHRPRIESADGASQCDELPPGYPEGGPCHGPVTITLKDDIDQAFRPNPAFSIDGFQVDLTPHERSNGFAQLNIEIDKSMMQLGFLPNELYPSQYDAGFRCSTWEEGFQSGDKSFESLADGDLKITTTYLNFGCDPTEEVGVQQTPFGAYVRGRLPREQLKLKDVLRYGVPFVNMTNYRSAFEGTVKVSKSDAKKLGLKSRTVGEVDGAIRNAADFLEVPATIALTKGARKALKGVKKSSWSWTRARRAPPGRSGG